MARELVKGPEDFTDVEQVCWLATRDGGRVDLARDRSPNAARKIQAALDAGAIDGEGWLTAIGREVNDSLFATPTPQPAEQQEGEHRG